MFCVVDLDGIDYTSLFLFDSFCHSIAFDYLFLLSLLHLALLHEDEFGNIADFSDNLQLVQVAYQCDGFALQSAELIEEGHGKADLFLVLGAFDELIQEY